tara:strand:+ start:4276 stop:4518 length:243 start_codon:yes stop_codon:yes gene_type:complete
MSIKTIKGIDEYTWSKFKSLAARDNLKMGSLFARMVDDYDRHCEEFWDKILNTPKNLSDKEAEAMLKTVKKLRSDYGFRK